MGVSHKLGASLPSDHDFPVDQAIQELMLTPPVAMQLLIRPSRAVPARTSQGFTQRAWQVPRQVQGPWQGSAQFPGALARKRGERPQLAGRIALLELQHGAAMPEEAVPIEASVHEVLWVSPLYLVHSPVTRHEPANSANAMASSGSFSFGCFVRAVPLLPTPSFSFPSQPAASSFPFTNEPAPTPCRRAPVHPATSPSEVSQAPVPGSSAPPQLTKEEHTLPCGVASLSFQLSCKWILNDVRRSSKLLSPPLDFPKIQPGRIIWHSQTKARQPVLAF